LRGQIGAGNAVEVELDGFGIKGRPIVKNNIIPQSKGVHQTVARNGPRVGQARHKLAGFFIQINQRIVDGSQRNSQL